MKKYSQIIIGSIITISFILGVQKCFSSGVYDNADFLADAGIIQSWSTTPANYDLEKTITRREMLKIMMNLSGNTVDDTCSGVFQDINSDDWGCKYAEAAVDSGFIAQNTLFRPNDNVSQIEALKMIMQALKIEKTISDDWRVGYVLAAREGNIIDQNIYQYDTLASRNTVFNIAALGLGATSKVTTSKDVITAQNIDITQLKTTQQYKSVDGVDPDTLSLDIYYPSDIENIKAVVMYVHGGGWSIGDKSAQLENKIALFKSLNYVFVSTNYRLSPFPNRLGNDDRIKYPLHNQDVVSAIAWLVENISDYGGNPDKVALIGHSAGAHLVSLIGTDESFLRQEGLSFENISGIISIDTEGYDVVQQINEGSTQNLYKNAFGDDQEIMIQASPIHHVSWNKNHPPFFVGKRVSEEKVASADAFITSLQKNNIPVTVIDGSNYSHAGINDAIGNPNDTTITAPLIEFLENIFE